MSGSVLHPVEDSSTKKHINNRRKHVLKSRRYLESLKSLNDKYVLVPADKAANNVIVVCKKYYLEVVIKEITATTTYEPVVDDKTKVISKHLKYMASNHITVKPELQCPPSFYWLPKLHEQPYGSRFIAASYRCTTKPLSKLLTCCLNTIMTHFRQYCNGIYCKTGVNCFWVIENSQHVLSTLNTINYFSSAKHSDSYDFSTLYTSIPHNFLHSQTRDRTQGKNDDLYI